MDKEQDTISVMGTKVGRMFLTLCVLERVSNQAEHPYWVSAKQDLTEIARSPEMTKMFEKNTGHALTELYTRRSLRAVDNGDANRLMDLMSLKTIKESASVINFISERYPDLSVNDDAPILDSQRALLIFPINDDISLVTCTYDAAKDVFTHPGTPDREFKVYPLSNGSVSITENGTESAHIGIILRLTNLLDPKTHPENETPTSGM